MVDVVVALWVFEKADKLVGQMVQNVVDEWDDDLADLKAVRSENAWAAY